MAELLNVALSAWIIKDGNYDDFEEGQGSKFALEFFAPNGLSSTEAERPWAEHEGACRYRVRARVIFSAPTAWVIDAGAFLAYRNESPPEHATLNQMVEGEIELGVDPFFYANELQVLDRIPPLSYRWVIREIRRDTTPRLEGKDGSGGSVVVRDRTKESFIPVHATHAWDDDRGDAEYVLGCERLGGPEFP